MPMFRPEWFLTKAELTRKAAIESEARVVKARHTELVKKMQMPGGLDDDEIHELRGVNARFTKLFDEHQSLLAKNPMLPENILKHFDGST